MIHRLALSLWPLVSLAALAHAGDPISLTRGDTKIELNDHGIPVRIEPGSKSVITGPGATDAAISLLLGKTEHRLTAPVEAQRLDETHARYRFSLSTQPPLNVVLDIVLDRSESSTSLRQQLTIHAEEKLTEDLTMRLPLMPGLETDSWLPRFNGTGGKLGDQSAAVYRLAGTAPGQGERLAIPLVSTPLAGSTLRATLVADPYFSTGFDRSSIEWTYPSSVGLEKNSETRQFALVLHEGSADDAIRAFYREALSEVPPGPSWLHEVTLVDYDFMSDQGEGWARDISALSEALPTADHHHAFLCLHGWYDWIGRYCFDPETKKFVSSWTALGRYDEVKQNTSSMELEGTQVDTGFRKCRPVAMTLAGLHERIALARKAGFRVGLYFADGLIAGTSLPGYDNPRRILRMGGWPGPDTPGQAFCQNPLVPEVCDFYIAYTDALLAEFGNEIDALVWDETFTVPAGSLGSKEVPGYADRAMMRLVRNVADRVERFDREHSREIAFLTSDCLGAGGDAPYALMAHGTYQDSWCKPEAWSYAIFSNYRNVVWSCCWWPESRPNWVDFGVRNYQAPVAISNGWGDNLGFAELTPERREQVLRLFQERKRTTTRLQWFADLPRYVSPAASGKP